jgi:hypothetical protein
LQSKNKGGVTFEAPKKETAEVIRIYTGAKDAREGSATNTAESFGMQEGVPAIV